MQIDMQVLIRQLETFLVLILFGFLANKIHLLTDELHDKLNSILMRVVIPALLISTMAGGSGEENFRLLLPMLAGGVLLFGFLAAAGLLSAKLMGFLGDKRDVQIAVMSFSSLGFFGIPLVSALLGGTGTAAFGIFSIVDNLTVWTIGLVLSRGESGKGSGMSFRQSFQKFIQPATIAVFIGLLLMVLRVPSDNLLMQSLSGIGNCSNPLAMLCIGASIARSDLRRLYLGWPSLSVVLVKMILSPLLVYRVAIWLGVYPPAAVSLTLIACLPSSSMFSLMCRDNGNTEVDYATQAAIITVFCSLFTIPLVAWLLR